VDGDKALAILVGGHLDTVSFVMDYVEFRINYNVLRAVSDPAVQLPDGSLHRFPRPGSRDALCTLIDSTVARAAEVGSRGTGHHRIELETDRGHMLTIPLDFESRVGPEAAHLVPADERGQLVVEDMWVW
jgi:hypothetical protein